MNHPKRQHCSSIAREAEDLVARLLQQQAWTILARNFRYVGCELDVVASKGRTLIIVGVKGRRRPPKFTDDIAMLLSTSKRAALLRGARAFLAKRGHDYESVRFDLAIVTPDFKQKNRLHIDYRVQAFE